MESEVEECLRYFDLVYNATHEKESSQFSVEEGAFVAAGKFHAEKVRRELKAASELAEKNVKEATKAAEKLQAKLNAVMAERAVKEAEKEAAKKAAKKAWLGVATKKAKAEALQKSVQALTKEATELVAKAATKQTAKVGAEAAAKSAAKKVPVVGLVAGGIFGAVRVANGVYNLAKGNKTRGIEEFGKAFCEVASGAASTLPGPGTAISLTIDAGLLAWDVGDAVHDNYNASVAKQPDSPPKVLVKYYVSLIHDAIEKSSYSLAKFLDDVFKITFDKIHCQTDKWEAAKNAEYIYEMVKDIFDDAYFAGKFPTEDIAQEMAKKGFSKCQIDIFRALAEKEGRK